MQCRSCQHESRTDARFCDQCGPALAPALSSDYTPQSTPRCLHTGAFGREGAHLTREFGGPAISQRRRKPVAEVGA